MSVISVISIHNESAVPVTVVPTPQISPAAVAPEPVGSPAPAATSPVPPDTQSGDTTARPVQNGGRVKEYDGLQVDTQTGEILTEPNHYDDYAAYEQEALLAMKEEEKNILVHREHAEPDDGREPGGRW